MFLNISSRSVTPWLESSMSHNGPFLKMLGSVLKDVSVYPAYYGVFVLGQRRAPFLELCTFK